MDKLKQSTNVIDYSINYAPHANLYQLAGLGAIFFIIMFAVIFWYSLVPEGNSKDKGAIMLFKWAVLVSLLWPICGIVEYSFLRS